MLSVYVVFFFFLYNQTDDCVLRNFKYINVGYTSEKLWHSGGGLIHYGSILWHNLGKNPILMGYVVLGIGYGVSAHDLSGYKVLGVLVVDNGPHVKEPLTALLKPIPKS